MTVRDLIGCLDYWTWLVVRPETGFEGIGIRVRKRDWLLGTGIPESLLGVLDWQARGVFAEQHTDPSTGSRVPMVVATAEKPAGKRKDNYV